MKRISEIFLQMEEDKNSMEFLPTGFHSLDQELDGGFLRKELVMLGGQTGIGKSYVAQQVMYNIAKKGFKTAYFSLEISDVTVASRLAGSLANIKSTRVRSGLLSLIELEDVQKAKAQLEVYDQYMTFYDDIYSLEEIEKEIQENGYEFVIIDFIQNIITQGNDEYSRLSYAALELQKFAKATNACFLVLSQVSNSYAREQSSSPNVEYKGSGNIATVCDLGFFIERTEDTYGSGTDKLRLCLKKNRRGSSKLYFDLMFKNPGGYIYETEN